MVRKRSRRYSNNEENESDSDNNLETSPGSPAPKKYSLRQRKRPVFIDDFDYGDDGEEIIHGNRSEDEDFQVSSDRRRNSRNKQLKSVNNVEENQENELIDFEDVIRADVVVNKNRVDYDNVINKTEIKVPPLADFERKTTRKSRKSRIKSDDSDNFHMLEPETNLEESSESIELIREDLIDPMSILQTELTEGEHRLPTGHDDTIDKQAMTRTVKHAPYDVTQVSAANGSKAGTDDTERSKIEFISDEDLLFNDLTEQERTKFLHNKQIEETAVCEDLDDSDDVILVEDERQNVIIVLDDD